MKRREFIAALGGTAAWPLVARAQSERVRRIGVLMNVDNADNRASYAAFVEALQRLGWTDGRNVQIETRWGGSRASDIRRDAADLVALAPEVLFAFGNAALPALLQATHTVPIVFATVTDPVGAGFIDSMAHPGGNATGFVMFEYALSGKWLELLKEIAPSVTRAAVLRDPLLQWARPIRDHTVRGAGARGGGDSDQLTRCRRRYRTRRHGVCRLPKWRPRRGGKRIGSGPSRTDHRACG
jgi:putative ABC transport system substrate-binding protein